MKIGDTVRIADNDEMRRCKMAGKVAVLVSMITKTEDWVIRLRGRFGASEYGYDILTAIGGEHLESTEAI